MNDESDLLKRIQRLESENLKMKWLGGLLAIFLVAMLVVGHVTKISVIQANEIHAREFILNDDSGGVLARLRHNHLQTCLELNGKSKVSQAYLCVGDDYGSDLGLFNQHGADRAFLSAGTQTLEPLGYLSPGLMIGQRDGENLITATLDPEAELTVGHGDKKGSIVISSVASKPTIRVLDGNGKTHWTVQ
jgi:hypothetical protein